MNPQAALPRRGYGQFPVFVEDHEFVVGVKEAGAGERAILPCDLSVLDVDRGEEGRAEVAARTVDHVAHAHCVAEMDSDSVVRPDLFRYGLIAAARESNHTAARAV